MKRVLLALILCLFVQTVNAAQPADADAEAAYGNAQKAQASNDLYDADTEANDSEDEGTDAEHERQTCTDEAKKALGDIQLALGDAKMTAGDTQIGQGHTKYSQALGWMNNGDTQYAIPEYNLAEQWYDGCGEKFHSAGINYQNGRDRFTEAKPYYTAAMALYIEGQSGPSE